MPTITRSATLASKEVFILPPGAKLLGATDINAFTNSCVNPTLETIGCYVAIVAAAGHDGNEGQFYEDTGANIIGYRMNGVSTMFPTAFGANPIGAFDMTNLAEIMKSSFGGIIETSHSFVADSGNRGTLNYLLIQTVPSVANSLELLYQGTASIGVTNSAAVSRVPFTLLATLTSAGYEGLPTCPAPDPED